MALWLPLSSEFMLIERAVWMIGGITLPLDPLTLECRSEARAACVLGSTLPGPMGSRLSLSLPGPRMRPIL